MTAPQSTPLPTAPARNQSEGTFVTTANAFVAALEPFRVELQEQADFVNTESESVDTALANTLAAQATTETARDVAVNAKDDAQTAAVAAQTAASTLAYTLLGDYAGAIEITSYDQIVRESGEFWRVSASVSLPYTTSGVWATDDEDFVSVGDATLRTDLVATDGAELVGYGAFNVSERLDRTTLNYTLLSSVVADTNLAIPSTGDLYVRVLERDNALFKVVLASSVTPNTYNIVQCTGVATLALEMVVGTSSTVAQWGAAGDGDGAGSGTDDHGAFTTAIDYYNSMGGGKILVPWKTAYRFESPLIAKSNVEIEVIGSKRVVFDFTNVFTVGSGVSYLFYNSSAISNFKIKGIKIKEALTSFNNNGFDKYCLRLVDATKCYVFDCEAEGSENGLVIASGSTKCTIESSTAFNCYLHGIASFGTSGSPNTKIELIRNNAYSDETTNAAAPISGIYFEETYDSEMSANHGWNCRQGGRVENSCDNDITKNHFYENWASGMELYIASQRNYVSGNHLFDNNRANHNDIDLTANKGNADTKLSGLNIENISDNNAVIGNFCYQTPATTVPFTSGSAEPTIGDTISGQTSGETGRVRRIDLDSGTWGGGDAAGTFHLVDATGEFNSSETLDNDDTPTIDIGTTDGTTTLGTSKGFQKYGIGVNIRNLTGVNNGDSYNTIKGNNCFNNDEGQIEDRGYYNTVEGNNEHFVRIVRNV